MGRLDVELSHYFAQANPELAKKMRTAMNYSALQRAVKYVWRENEWSAHFILAHVNAFYVLKEDKPVKKKFRDSPWIVCTICIDDGLVRADVDARQELLKLALANENIHFDELRLLPSKLDMKKRHPFKASIDLLNGSVFATDDRKEEVAAPEPISQETLDEAVGAIDDPELARRLGKAMVASAAWAHEAANGDARDFAFEHNPYRLNEGQENLETLKKALFLTFGTNADEVLAKMNRIYPKPRLFDPRRKNRREFQTYDYVIYSSDPRLATVMDGYGDELRSRARTLRLRIGTIEVRPATTLMADDRAYPKDSAPILWDNDEAETPEE